MFMIKWRWISFINTLALKKAVDKWKRHLRIRPLFTVVFIFSKRCSTLFCKPQHITVRRHKNTEALLSLLTHLQVSDAEFFLENVGCVCACSQASHRGQVAAVSAHRLHNEDAALGPSSRLFDPVAGLWEAKEIWVLFSRLVQLRVVPCEGAHWGDSVEGSVGADAEVRARDVVGDGGRDDHNGNAHLLVFLSCLDQLKASNVSL